MTRARNIFHAVTLLSKSKNRDTVKWSEIYKGLHRRAILPSTSDGNIIDKSVNSITSKDISLLFEGFSRISKCKELVELNTTQRIPINPSQSSNDADSTNRSYNEYTFGFYDLVNLYLPSTLECVDNLDIYETYKLLSFLKTLGQESYILHNLSHKLSEKFANECSLLSTFEICQLIKIFTGYQNHLTTHIITPLINILHNNIMSLDINQVYEIIETLYLINEIPCNQILYDCYIRLREEYNNLSIKRITFILSCYSRHYKYTHTYIKALISQFSDCLVNKFTAKFNDRQQLSKTIDARLICQLFKSYSTIGYISRELFDILFDAIHYMPDKLSLLNYSTLASSLSSLQLKHNLYLYSYVESNDYSNRSSLLPETYNNFEKVDYNPIRIWLKVKQMLKYKREDCPSESDKFAEKNELKALILLPKENYHSNFIRWWNILLTNLSSCIEKLKAGDSDPPSDLANTSIRILDSLAESGQSHFYIVSQLLHFIKDEIDSFSGVTLLSLLCNLQSLQIYNSDLFQTVISNNFNDFTPAQSLICISMILANSERLQKQHLDFLHAHSSAIDKSNPSLFKSVDPFILTEIAGYLSLVNERNISKALINLVKTNQAKINLAFKISPWLEELVTFQTGKFYIKLAHSQVKANDNLIYSRLRTSQCTLPLNSTLPTIEITDEHGDFMVIPYHWELESFKKSLHLIQLALSQKNITYRSKCTINSCPIDMIYHTPDENGKFVVLCLVPDEFDTSTVNYPNTCFWKTRLAYLNTLGLDVKVITNNTIDNFLQN